MSNIKIDATQVTYSSFGILGNGRKNTTYDGSAGIQTFELSPGDYTLTISARGIEIPFSVIDGGAIDYPEDADKDQYRTGRGTDTLTIKGLPVIFNTDVLTKRDPFVAQFVTLPNDNPAIAPVIETRSLNLVPGEYGLRVSNAADSYFNFTLRSDGTFSYENDYDVERGGFLQGIGSSTLKFIGYPIQIDARQLSFDRAFSIRGGMPQSTSLDPKEVQSIVVLPGFFIYDNPYPTELSFEVTTTGAIACKSQAVIVGVDEEQRPKRKLTVRGFTTTIDATDITGTCSLVASDQTIEGIKSFQLLPNVADGHALSYAGTQTACFGLTQDGQVIYPSQYEVSAESGFLSGAGTAKLKISGYPLEIDTKSWQKSSLFIGKLEIRPGAPTPQTVKLLPQESIKLRIATTPPAELDLSLNNNGDLTKLDTYPDLNVIKEGRTTRLVFGKAPDPQAALSVKGIISQVNGKPLAEAIVRAFDKDLRSEILLGEQTTNNEGSYSISYSKEQLHRTDKQQADLVVRVFNVSGELLVASDVILNASPLQEVNLQLPIDGTQSEWERITQAALPLLKSQKQIQTTEPGTPAQFVDLPPEELQDSDLDFLAKETQIDREQIRFWILGAKAMRATIFIEDNDFPPGIAWLDNINAIAPNLSTANLAEWIAFYGWFRQGTATEVGNLLNSSTSSMIESLQQAIAQKVIPNLNQPVDLTVTPTRRTGLDVINSAIQRYRIDVVLRPAKEGEPASLGDVMKTIPTALSLDKLLAVATILQDNNRGDLAERLASSELTENEVRSVQRTLGLQSIAQNHLPMISALQITQPDDRQAQIRELANLDLANWEQLVAQHGFPKETVGETDVQKQQNYAGQIAQAIEKMHPSNWIAYRLQDNRFPVPLEESAKSDLGTFLAQNPEFQMGKTQAIQYFDTSDRPVLSGITDPARVKEDVLKIERVVNSTPSLDISGKLLAMGVNSAYAIAQRSEKGFVAEVSAQYPEMAAQAQATYRQAISINAAATAIATEYIRAERGIPFAIMNPPAEAATNETATALTANLRSLFGNLDFCACEYCSSIYSPAAYLVDLMNVLDVKTGSKSPLDTLLERRPDLLEIDLTCDNTNISIPYIDLVLEVLENEIASGTFSINNNPPGIVVVGQSEISSQLNNGIVPQRLKDTILEKGFTINSDVKISKDPEKPGRWVLHQAGLKVVVATTRVIRLLSVSIFPQTSGTTAEISAVPAFVNPQPYNNSLRNAVYPWSLPFDLWLEETRVWLKQLNVDRSALMAVFVENSRYNDLDSAIEFLGFSKSEADRLMTNEPSPWLLWGFAPEAVSTDGMVSPSEILDPIAGRPLSTNASTLWIEVLKERVSLIRYRAGLTQRELMNLLELEFCQSEIGISPVKLKIEGDECDASLMKIPNLSKGALIRIHAFVRLWRKLGWSMFDLDRAIATIPQPFNPGGNIPFNEITFTKEFLIEIANIERLRQQLGMPIGILLNWYSRKLNTQAYVDYSKERPQIVSSPYESLFYDRAVARPKDVAFELNSDRSEILTPVPLATIRSKLSLVAAALSAKPTEIEALLPRVEDTIGLQEITQLTSGIAVDITGATTTANATIELDLREIRGTGASFTIRLQHSSSSDPASFVDIPPENLNNAAQPTAIMADNLKQPLLMRFVYSGGLSSLRIAVTEVMGTDLANNPPRLRMTAKILLDPAVVRDDLSLRNLSAISRYTSMAKALGLSVKELLLAQTLMGIDPFITTTATLSFIDRLQQVRSSGFSLAELDYLLRHDSLERSGIALTPSKAVKILTEIRQSLQQIQTDAASQVLASKLSAEIGVDPGLTNFLLDNLKYTRKPIAEIFLDPAFINSDLKVGVDRNLFPAQFDVLELSYKTGLIISRWSVTPDQIGWLFGSTWLNLLNFSQLPLAPNSQNSLFFPWIDLLTLLQLRDRFPGGATTLAKIGKLIDDNPAVSSNWDNFQNAVADMLNWPSSDFKVLLSSEGLGFARNATEDDFKQPRKLMQLVDCLDLIRKLGGTAEQVIAWKKPLLTPNDALAARQLVRSRYDQESWYKLAQPLQNKLRQKRRKGLLDYLIAKEGVRDANDLFGKYLIDPEMGDCMMTTRILQASSTVQLFIHRCLMGLEPEVPASAINKDRWKWMKNYRVWEANRKVFFYPENWIEPELRDDKTPFFRDLESELLQGDVTSEKAEKALRSYLAKVDDVARLEPIAICRDRNDSGLETFYVISRSYSTPHVHYLRRFHKLLPNDPQSGYWTAWEKIDLDLEGEHLTPVVWNGQLHLFWLIFTEKAQEPTTLSKDNLTPPEKYWSIKIAWSILQNGQWQSRKETLFWEDSRFLVWNVSPNIFSLAAKVNYLREQEGIRLGLYKNGYSTANSLLQEKIFYRYGISDLIEESSLFREFVVSLPGYRQSNQFIEFSNDRGELSLPAYFSSGRNKYVLENGKGATTIVFPLQDDTLKFATYPEALAFLFASATSRVFFAYPYQSLVDQGARIGARVTGYYDEAPSLRISIFYHPQIFRFCKLLDRKGLGSFLTLNAQREGDWPDSQLNTFSRFNPDEELVLKETWPTFDVEFGSSDTYSQYNWEIFFHLPFTVATYLTKNQRFEEARQWFHYIFDPTDSSSDPEPQRFWRFRPFHEKSSTTPIQTLALILADPNDSSVEKQEFRQQVQMWLENPFKPHAVAQFRNRAYMFSVVMKYLDNLIAWGDQLFRRDTRESLNEAAQIYVLAAQILGRRPESIPRRTAPKVVSFGDIRGQLDSLSNVQVKAESLLPSNQVTPTAQIPQISTLLFCVPENQKILDYYDKVADRLFKIRNCMNIDGVVRQLALFDPPIDPAILVKAAAAGIDLNAVLSDLAASTPPYRFNVMAQKATELCGEVKNMGGALLAALEKRDGAAMALLRSKHEISLLQHQRQVKEYQVEEAKANIEAIAKSLESAQTRMTYYVGLVSVLEDLQIPSGPVEPQAKRLITATLETLSKTASLLQVVVTTINPLAASGYELLKQALSRAAEALDPSLAAQNGNTNKVPMIPAEQAQLDELKQSHDLQQKGKDYQAVAQLLAKIPDVTLGIQGFSSSPVIQAQVGGSLLSTIALAQANEVDYQAGEHAYRANLHSILAGYQRRAAEWLHQAKMAQIDIEQISKQGIAAAIRLKMAAEELSINDQQIANSQEVDEFMRSQYTNQELYDWMVGQISSSYFQCYQLAYDVAKRAEKAYRFELGLGEAETNFIQFGYWDSLRKGLLAGDRLFHDLKRMEVSYLEKNVRELEITQSFSLLQFAPSSLLKLQQLGNCVFSIPEIFFDLSYPGHFRRLIRSVRLTIPCVTGPYTNVNATLRLIKSEIRRDPAESSNLETVPPNYSKAIATSTAQNDAGVFELNFRDERYLPFEGAGAISDWNLELPNQFRTFDYNTISDAIVTISYTAREDGKLKNRVEGEIATLLNSFKEQGLYRLISLKLEFPSAFHQLFNSPGTRKSTSFELSDRYFPYFMAGKNLTASELKIYLKPRSNDPINTVNLDLEVNDAIVSGEWKNFPEETSVLKERVYTFSGDPRRKWEIKSESGVLNQQALDDILILLKYEVNT